uniref:late competence development ComFB family protein n=1 Tax=Eubacterium cellulosolvens TaxID=29322 RepID=UPI000489FCB4|nr:late competence development ComFB family protein [[Eubacterium] cellulosolvens]
MTDNEKISRTTVRVVDESSEIVEISDAIQKRLEASVFGEDTAKEGKKQGYHVVNVIAEVMKRENVLEIMQELGVCTCQRCQADVLALTLTQTKPKYCVMYDNEKALLISDYARIHQKEIHAKIMRACIVVQQHPHHHRRDEADSEYTEGRRVMHIGEDFL